MRRVSEILDLGRLAPLIFGDLATHEKCRKFLRVAVLVIALDLTTKLLALRLVSAETPLELWGGAITIQLYENATLLGAFLHKAGSLHEIFASGIATLVLAAAALLVVSARDKPLKKFLVLIGILLGAWLSSRAFGGLIARPLSPRFVGVTRSFGALVFNVLVLRIALNKRLFVAISLVTSANLANGLNFLWHPAGVIDFVWIRALRKVLGVANLADLVMTLTFFWLELLFVLWLCSELLWRISSARPRRRALRSFLVSAFATSPTADAHGEPEGDQRAPEAD